MYCDSQSKRYSKSSDKRRIYGRLCYLYKHCFSSPSFRIQSQYLTDLATYTTPTTSLITLSLIPSRIDSSSKVLKVDIQPGFTTAPQIEATLVDRLVSGRSKVINPEVFEG